MKLTTTKTFDASPEQLWPLLFNSKMNDRHPCYFLCGLPKPLECRLQNDQGGVGATRECVSDKGIIKQNILEWEPDKKLKFELRETNIYFGPCVDSIVETFEIKQINHQQSSITRSTEFIVKSALKPFISIPMFIGLKSIHRYVFNNWHELAKQKKEQTILNSI
jgi:hypothetical protein